MMFLLPSSGVVDFRFGMLVTPSKFGVSIGIKSGMLWAADNEAFTKEFNPDVFFPWLETMRAYKDRCLFVTVPDVVGNCKETIRKFNYWKDKFGSWPLAFVAQDGQEFQSLPEGFDVIFIGGSTEWKMGTGAINCIKKARSSGKRVHIGRVNTWKRYKHFANLQESCDEWTCDGTRVRFDGRERTIKIWSNYMERYKRQIRMPLFGSDSGG